MTIEIESFLFLPIIFIAIWLGMIIEEKLKRFEWFRNISMSEYDKSMEKLNVRGK